MAELTREHEEWRPQCNDVRTAEGFAEAFLAAKDPKHVKSL
jgi:hypothetical protein